MLLAQKRARTNNNINAIPDITSYSVKPKFIDFIGFDDFYLPQKQSRE